jgi:hypothetical protein
VRPTLLCLLLALAGMAADSAMPQVTGTQSPPLPPWVVPVLRLVSATHVEPTTGIVVGAQGLVLVPASFAARGDEIVVLDGGTDIVRNGRPARLERGFPELGLEVLAVTDLDRRGAPLAPSQPADGETLHLAAFPPAEQIAEGALPLVRATRSRVATGSDNVTIDASAPLPNVSGALLDACGNLVGVSLADGLQSLEPNPATRYRWTADLRAVFDALGLEPAGVDCSIAPAIPEDPAPAAPETPPAEEPAAATEPAAEEAPAEAADEPPQDPQLELLPPFEKDVAATPSEPAAEPEASASWGWLLAALVLFGGGFALHRLRRAATPEVAEAGAAAAESAAADASRWSAPEANDRIVLSGTYADGRVLELSAAADRHTVNLVIGRGAADLPLDSSAVSRRHARLEGSATALTLEDLGSSNGTSINGVPCLAGEVMYLGPDDMVVLGDVRFTVEIVTDEGDDER